LEAHGSIFKALEGALETLGGVLDSIELQEGQQVQNTKYRNDYNFASLLLL